MIASFADRDAETLFRRERAKPIDSRIQRMVLRKPRYLDSAASLEDLRVSPGNRIPSKRHSPQPLTPSP
ncbi:MAG: hypothetical protein WC058_12355 [Phycisphaeraceae bacterium]